MAWALVENGAVKAIFNRPKAITLDGIQHPSNIFTIWSKEQKKAIGLYDYVEVGKSVDKRYYDVRGGSVTIDDNAGVVTKTYSQVEKDLAPLQTAKVEEIKRTAASLLAPTDWMVIRAAEGGTAVPTTISTYRENVRAKSNEFEGLVNEVINMEGYIALHDNQLIADWPSVPEQ